MALLFPVEFFFKLRSKDIRIEFQHSISFFVIYRKLFIFSGRFSALNFSSHKAWDIGSHGWTEEWIFDKDDIYHCDNHHHICRWPTIVQTRSLHRCEFASQLYILDVPKSELPLWLCIAEYESRFNTHVIGARNADGSNDYGIFQISDKYWCKPENRTDYFIYNGCNVNCSALLSDDITLAVRCARYIQKQQGWSAWAVYKEFCSNGSLEHIDDCFT
uniref:Lysozyme n=1 Tax=Glossina austeni TaxID=7395 RepID=A0A1A9UZF8_GLOAU